MDTLTIKYLGNLFNFDYIKNNLDDMNNLITISKFYYENMIPLINTKMEIKRISVVLNTYLNDKFENKDKTFLTGSASFTMNTIGKKYDSLNLLFENYYNFIRMDDICCK